MAKRRYLKGATSQSIAIFLQDSSQTDGRGLISVTSAINAGYLAGGVASTFTTFALSTIATSTGAYGSGNFVEYSSVKAPGLYRLDVPDAVFASTPFGVVMLTSGSGGANLAPVVVEFEIASTEDYPVNVTKWNGSAVGSLPTNFASLSITSSGEVLSKLSSGTGVGQIVLTNGQVTASNVPSNFTSLLISSSGEVTAKTLSASAISSASVTAGFKTDLADAFLDRDMSVGTDSGTTAVRTPRQSLRALRNKFDITGTTYTVYKEDDATASWTAVVTGSSSVNPITAIDPA